MDVSHSEIPSTILTAIFVLGIWFSPVITFIFGFVYLERRPLLARGFFRAALTLGSMLVLFAIALVIVGLRDFFEQRPVTAADWVFGCLFPVPIILVVIASPIMLSFLRAHLEQEASYRDETV